MNSPAESDRITRPTDPDGLVLEAWGQGLMVGSLVVMAAVTISNMRKHILLHKLIFAELILAIPHGTWIFSKEPIYGWHLSASAIGLNVSWSLHNVIAWMKNRPFFSKRVSNIYIITVLLVQPYWVLEIYANFTYFNNVNKIFLTTRPLEPLFRELVTISPRFGIMLASMCLSLAFVVVDECSVLGVFNSASLPSGVQPFWKLSFIFKCLCDTVILDDFKTALDRMRDYWFQKQVRGGDIILHGGDGHRRLGYSGRAVGDEDYDIEMMSNGAQQGSDFGKGTSDSFPHAEFTQSDAPYAALECHTFSNTQIPTLW
ncbi:predicted protein [Aspergillus nidulans FGSC A4]|uniref:Uncharacterized protein n=1 Tax=Emericella nidulans (strain FGSC A4 / ATCC 38163 / CBS 112.46 / NRRL 194 / M139) TaxID=227321 RepID=Q5BC64_EMENI|nr:hypothetical protein [Aspergillus nidulans FGSC A4]EAA65031.1 predicted protein [Aspergillus nidulans FGSC A4]CBF85719.1 TPA: conserved hypothetical protein [Aspergillus nidulans FGSC A4]|eukprot:XP_659470.1 predicted protein [Aspergillus nidulans FGSC A4]